MSNAIECPRCGEIELALTGHVLEAAHTGDEYECQSCGHYEVHWRRTVALEPVQLEVVS